MLRQFIAPFLMIGIACAADSAPSVDWIGGHWCAELGEEIVEELWLPPHGGVAIGMGRTRTNDRTTGFEYLRIVDLDGVLRYIAQPGGRPPTVFNRTAGGERWIRFENPDHDFPQRIEYRREGDALHAEIAGPGDNGTEMVISFDYRRCGSIVAATDRFELEWFRQQVHKAGGGNYQTLMNHALREYIDGTRLNANIRPTVWDEQQQQQQLRHQSFGPARWTAPGDFAKVNEDAGAGTAAALAHGDASTPIVRFEKWMMRIN